MHYLTGHDTSAYTSQSQKIRILTESWVRQSIFCPACGSPLTPAKNNSAACDFLCSHCSEEFELKSKKGGLGKKLTNGAYASLMSRLTSLNNPNLYLLNYDHTSFEVLNFLVVPNFFFTPSIIEKRKPLAATARRAGWTGCNILVGNIPETGKIYYIKNRQDVPKPAILHAWQKTAFLKSNLSPDSRGWLIDTMDYIDRIGSQNFTLDMLYTFEPQLRKKYPRNKHIKDKLRQQLQILRDKRYIEFVARGQYRRVSDNFK